MTISTITGLFLIVAPTAETRKIELHVLIGRDCGTEFSPVLMPDWRTCSSRNIAELVVDGKVVGTIPIGDLSEKELLRLNDSMQWLRK